MTFINFIQRFSTEKAAIDYFLHIHCNNKLICPYCKATIKVYRYRDRAKVCHCKNCNNSFSLFSNTIFEKSRTDMRKWFYVIHLFLIDKAGISVCRLQKEMGVTYKTAWRMLNMIREAMEDTSWRKIFEMFAKI